jgi:hypothetical protein
VVHALLLLYGFDYKDNDKNVNHRFFELLNCNVIKYFIIFLKKIWWCSINIISLRYQNDIIV